MWMKKALLWASISAQGMTSIPRSHRSERDVKERDLEHPEIKGI